MPCIMLLPPGYNGDDDDDDIDDDDDFDNGGDDDCDDEDDNIGDDEDFISQEEWTSVQGDGAGLNSHFYESCIAHKGGGGQTMTLAILIIMMSIMTILINCHGDLVPNCHHQVQAGGDAKAQDVAGHTPVFYTTNRYLDDDDQDDDDADDADDADDENENNDDDAASHTPVFYTTHRYLDDDNYHECHFIHAMLIRIMIFHQLSLGKASTATNFLLSFALHPR